ncbi:response regulator [Sulfitobacter sp. S0837]|uniref:response regulator n=1 Tax=Sulfitobacter maritimus TaxID=2741719 RepID=UPI0015823EA8|nr:response regulator [Sulfitobacter maritimus]NUH63760.1 response regulator [Sulfitobacter maritimus]NUH63763.1 response regulator [Sulfitobacter maritimus]NUH66367.1 response regulator [Sulfitobacter maritimus]
MIKLLHVDDEADILEIARMALEISGGVEVVSCLSGERALVAAKQGAPDVFLLDVMMPGMTGPQTLAALREVPGLADVPAIFLTASQHDGKETELLAAGAIAVLKKPFDPLTLGDEIKKALNGN